MKRKILFAVCMISALLFGPCQPLGLQSREVKAEAVSDASGQESSEGEADADIFKQLPETFYFSSGAGAWGTTLTMRGDGYFVGDYHDSEMGDIGEGYPYGSVYICRFKGNFSQPLKLDDCTYSMELEALEMEGKVGESYIQDNVRYVYSEPYGMEDGETFMLYLPGCQVQDLPEAFVSWSHILWEDPDAQILDCYGIYNLNAQTGFVAQRETGTGPEASTQVQGEYFLPDSASRYLQESDVASMSKESVQKAINEIYARHGRVFTTPEWSSYFQAQSWYQPAAGKTDDQIVTEFNEYERYNVDFLAKYL